MKGYDYDGVVTNNILPGPGDVIITGRSCAPEDVERTHRDMIRHGLSDCGPETGHVVKVQAVAVYFMPTAWKAPIGPSGHEGLIKTGEWKALMIDALDLEEYFEDDPVQHQSIRDHLKGNTKITKV